MTRADEIRAKLDKIKAAIEAGTSGEWHVAASGVIDAGDYGTALEPGPVLCGSYCQGGTGTLDGDDLDANLALIVLAVNVLPGLVELAEAQVAMHEAPHTCPETDGLVDVWFQDACPVILGWHALLVGAK